MSEQWPVAMIEVDNIALGNLHNLATCWISAFSGHSSPAKSQEASICILVAAHADAGEGGPLW